MKVISKLEAGELGNKVEARRKYGIGEAATSNSLFFFWFSWRAI